MKKIIFLFLFLFANLTTSADDGTAYTPPNPDMPLNCASPATQIRDVTINELYNGGGGAGNLEFFEIYFNETTNIAGWRLYANDHNTNQYTNLGIGFGDVTYPNGSTGLDDLATHTYPKGTFIVYKIDNIDPTNGEVFVANTTSALTSGANVVVDYFKYYKTSEQTYYTVTDSACSTALTGTDSNAKDISRLTDGSGDFYQYYPGTTTLVDYTTGASNLENLPSNSTLEANVSIQADFNQTQAYSGDLITLTLKITNPSANSITVTDVNVTNLIPAGLSYVSNDGGTLLDPILPSNPYGTVTATTPTFRWRLINTTKLLSFPTNSIAEINITLRVTATAGTIITDTATLATKQKNQGTISSSDTIHIFSPAPMLNVCGTEDFSEYSASVPLSANWNIMTASNYTPNVQNGKLMLTGNTNNISTAVTLNGELPAANNYLELTFQSFAYGGTGADGITLTLSDAAVTPAAGAFGGSLGYAQKCQNGVSGCSSDCTTIGGCPGFNGGWLGFGIDEYGNFSNPTEGRIGGPNQRQDSVSIRGSGSGTTGYPYIAGTTTLTPGIDQAAEGPGHWYRMSIDTRNAKTLVKVERNTNSNGTGSYTPIINWTDATQTATSPTNYRLSLTGSTGGSNNYHAADNFTLKALSCGTIQIIPPSARGGQFDAWDSFRSISDRNISTKIVAKDFNLTVASLNSANTAMKDFNGTVCATIINRAGTAISGSNKLLFNAAQSLTSTFKLNRAIGGSDYAGIKLHWKKNVNEECPLAGEDNTTIASDYFAVRPASFTVNAPNAIAGSDFNITFTAPIFTASTASTDYNETAGGSFDVNYAERNASCVNGIFSPILSSGWSFVNGAKALTTRYNEAGLIDVNISDTAKTCTSRFSTVDCDDANVSDGINWTGNLLPIGAYSIPITIKPHHFDLNATLKNSNNGIFTYLSTDLNMSASLEINATAKNAEGNTTRNYDKGCYAKNTTLILPHSIVPSPLSKIAYRENLSGVSGDISSASPLSLDFNKTIFTQGTAALNLLLNFDRNSSRPLNPFDFNITSASINDTDSVLGNTTPTGKATFVYGRARAYDIKTDQTSAPNPIELEVYSSSATGYVNGMPQNVLYWYRNLNHNTSSSGSILSGEDYSTTTKIGSSSTIAINPTLASPLNGLHNITISNPDAVSNAIIHLTIPSWLWYSALNNYDVSMGTKCTQHPCFDYQFFGNAASASTGVNSGTFQGSDFNLAPAKKIIKQGVKVFR